MLEAGAVSSGADEFPAEVGLFDEHPERNVITNNKHATMFIILFIRFFLLPYL